MVVRRAPPAFSCPASLDAEKPGTWRHRAFRFGRSRTRTSGRHAKTIESVSPAQSELVRPCPERDSNPHALSSIRLPDARVYQFRHPGTPTVMAD